MLIDGQKWACEACIRGHRVTSCKHHDRPLIRIKRKGRPFATCSICHSIPCEAPTEHAQRKREAEIKSSSKKAAHARLHPRHHNPNGFLPIAPRPSGSSGSDAHATSSVRVSRSASTSAFSSHAPACADCTSNRTHTVNSEGERDALERAQQNKTSGRSHSTVEDLNAAPHATISQALSHSAPDILALDPALSGVTFDPLYSLLPSSTSISEATMPPLVSPLENANPLGFPLDPALSLDQNGLGYLEDWDMDLSEEFSGEAFHVEDWSRYMWSPETGFEHLDTVYPPVSQ